MPNDIEQQQNAGGDSRETHSRRTIIAAGAGAVGLVAAGSHIPALAQDAATPVVEPAPVSCVLAPELTEGPYYLEGDLVRKDITEGRPGIPLTLRLTVSDVTACAPLANAAVDIWHCDAQGYYSGVASNNPGGDTDPALANEVASQIFLRGIQLTDADGVVEFETIYPGWYMGRTTHIHLKVAVEGQASETYEGGHVAHTGQLFFDDATSDLVYEFGAYAGRENSQRTRNDSDNILGEHADEPGFMIELTPLDEADLEQGFIGVIAFGIDPSATPADGGGSGGPGGPPPDSDG